MEIMDKPSGAGAAVTSETVQTLCYLASIAESSSSCHFLPSGWKYQTRRELSSQPGAYTSGCGSRREQLMGRKYGNIRKCAPAQSIFLTVCYNASALQWSSLCYLLENCH